MNIATQLDTPESAQTAAASLPFAPTAAGTNAWLNGLNQWMKPLSSVNGSEACRALFEVVQKLNTMELPAFQRLQLLEILRPRVMHYTAAMDRCFVDQPPLPEAKLMKLKRTTLRFHAELAANYRRIAAEAGFKETLTPLQKATAIHRGLASHGLYFLRASQLYEAPTEGYWSEAYAFFRSAEEVDSADIPVSDADTPFPGVASVRQALARIAIFHLANPLALQPRQMGQLFGLIGEQAEHIALTNHAPAQADRLYILDLGHSAPPHAASASAATANDVRYLSPSCGFADVFRSAAALSTFGAALAGRFAPLQEWDSAKASRPVVFSVGIEGATARGQCDGETLERLLSGRRSKMNEKLGLVPKDAEPCAVSAAGAAPVGGAQAVSREEIWAAREPATVAAQHSAFGLLNRDEASGRPILIGERRHLPVGSLVSYRTGDTDAVWALVRNATPTTDAERVWAELELLDASVEPVRIHIEGRQRRCLQALMCTSLDNSGTVRMLLPPISLANGTWLVVERADGQWINQRIIRLQEITSCLHSYQLVPAEASLRMVSDC